MAIVPHPGAEPAAHEGEPADYALSHPGDHPEQWGWHAEWGRYSRIGGWVSAVLLVVMATATHYNKAGMVALFGFAGFLVAALLWDRQRRRTAWRK